MPREIVLGNGELLVNLDRHLSIRDIYSPYVGWANHVGGYRCRVGVWVEGGDFAWLDDSWEWQIQYRNDSLVTDCAARHAGLKLSVRISHAVAPDRNIFLQRFIVENLDERARQARLFFAHDLRIDESDIGDTAYYNPFCAAMVHYKRDRYFLFSGRADSAEGEPTGIWQYACGEKGFRGAEGTWRDAEDGLLSMNSIAQGAVDSVHSYVLTIPAQGEATLRDWMTVGASLDEVVALQAQIEETGFEEMLASAEVADRNFTAGHPDLDVLPPRVAALYTRSLLVIRTQADRRGAIIASNDSDIMETARAHYSYMWPRDGALTSSALDKAGQSEIPRRFFEFCARVLPQDRAALMHKYGPDGTVGASWHPWLVDGQPEIPFQEDGTALVIWALRQHIQISQDMEFAEDLYRRFVRHAADFLAAFRDPRTHLPLPSWDIWEERRGAHIFTTAAVYAALAAAAQLAEEFDQAAVARAYQKAAGEVRAALLEYFWDESVGHFARMVTMTPEGQPVRDSTADSSSYAVFAFGVLPADDPRVVATMQTLGRKLWVRAGAGGLARYERDYYFRVIDDFEKAPGNPWIICTLWLADWYIATARTSADLKAALDLLEWAADCALPTGILPEQVHPVTRRPLSVAPLTWSHAQFVTTVTAYLEKCAEFARGEAQGEESRE